MGLCVSTMRTVVATLGVLASCLLVATTAEAATARRGHGRVHCGVCRRNVPPKQAFAHIATRRPDRFVRRQVLTLVRQARTTAHPIGGDAAIQTGVSTVLEAQHRPSPVLEPLGLLIPAQAQLRSHEGLARRSPRGPPALG